MESNNRAFKKNRRDYYLPVSLCLLLFFVSGHFSGLHAQKENDYAVHANIIYHFTKYIDWPTNKKTGDFIIGVIGDSPVYEELLEDMANKTVGKQKIIIKKFISRQTTFPCHILFIGEDESGDLKKIALRTSGEAVLLVSEEEGLAHAGSCINFITVSDHLKLEINKNNIDQRGLSIASELLQLGKLVQ